MAHTNTWTSYALRKRVLRSLLNSTYVSAILAKIVAWKINEDYVHIDHQERENRARKRAPRVDEESFLLGDVSAVVKLDISLVDTAREKVTQIIK